MKRAHFFDIDTIIAADSKVWLVSKKSPNSPLLRISQSDFGLMKGGIYRSRGNDLVVSGTKYWLTDEMFSSIKRACARAKCDISGLAFSMQEFMNPEVMAGLDYRLNMDVVGSLKNSPDDIYVVCSRNAKSNYSHAIERMEARLREMGLAVEKYYFISETFYSRNLDEIARNKVRLALQHLVGLKTEGDRFSGDELEGYDEVFIYDDDPAVLELASCCNALLSVLVSNSEPAVSAKVKDRIKSGRPALVSCKVSPNRVNPVERERVPLLATNVIKTFEAFRSGYPRI